MKEKRNASIANAIGGLVLLVIQRLLYTGPMQVIERVGDLHVETLMMYLSIFWVMIHALKAVIIFVGFEKK